MKRIFTFLISLIFLFTFCSTAFAVNNLTETSNQTYIEYFEDGSYIETTIIEETSDFSTFATVSKSGSKTLTYKDSDGNTVWSATLKGTFKYTGSSCTCTASSITYSVNNSNWKITSATASKSGNKAIGNVTVKKYVLGIPIQTIEKTITLTCSAAGVLS